MKITKQRLKGIIKEELLEWVKRSDLEDLPKPTGPGWESPPPKEEKKEEGGEELNEAWSDPFSEARGRVSNLVNRLQHEVRQGRPMVISSRAGDDVDVLEELTMVLDLLVQHQNDMTDTDLAEAYSEEQRAWACAQDDPKFDNMCRGPLKKKKA